MRFNLTILKPTYLTLTIFAIMLSGCVSIDKNLLLDKGTKVEIIDASTNYLVSRGVANSKDEVRVIVNRIITNTKEELEKRSIEAFTEYTPGAAKLKYDIRTINSGHQIIGSAYSVYGRDKFEVKYRVTFETPDGKKLFIDNEEKDDSDFDTVLERIASRTARFVSKCYKE